jgi:hypothetical protein
MVDLITDFDPADCPLEVITGVLYQGTKGSLNGASKTNKTWALTDLAVSVATGTPWWGLETNQGRVLYINFEIRDYFFVRRVIAVCQAKGVQLKKGQLDYFGLRGKAGDWSSLMSQLEGRLTGGGYALIIIDPIYKGLGGRDENKAGDVANLLNEVESLCVKSDAAVFYGHHFAKGNQKFKNVEDRASGSGVWARDPDTILTLTRLQESDCYVVDTVLRDFPQLPQFGVRWEYPLMIPDDSIDVTEIHEPGKAQAVTEAEIWKALRDCGPLGHNDWFKAVSNLLAPRNVALATFNRHKATLAARGDIVQDGEKRTDPWRVNELCERFV